MELPGRNSRRTGTENSMRICDQNIQPDGYGIRDRCSSGGSGSRSLPHFRKPQQQRRRKNIWNYGEIFAVLTAFNYATNGWIKTVDGFVALRVNGDARVTIPYNSFANDFRSTGKTIEFEFETRDVTDYDSVILSCMNAGIGLEVTAQKAIFRSEQTSIETQFKRMNVSGFPS